MSEAKEDLFVHLHVHSHFSILKGMCRIGPLVEQVKTMSSAVAITDYLNIYGAVDFYQISKKYDVKPIFGATIYLAIDELNYRSELKDDDKRVKLVLLAENKEGWQNLIKLLSHVHLEPADKKLQTITLTTLAEYSKGLICLTGGEDGVLDFFLEHPNKELQKKYQPYLEKLISIFAAGNQQNLYIELQRTGEEQREQTVQQLLALATAHSLPVVATNNVHFLQQADKSAHDVFACIGESRALIDEDRTHYSEEIYLKSPTEMQQLFADIPTACSNTVAIAKRCHVSMTLDPTSTEKYPYYQTPNNESLDDYLTAECHRGLAKIYTPSYCDELAALLNISLTELAEKLQQRLTYELQIITQLGFASYFLIVADFINWAKNSQIPVGPGRGSAAGSLVAYTLAITAVCPMRFGLLFERFLNPERVSPPDVDIDFCQSRRQEVIDYVRQKYGGERNVSHIVTYGKLGAKSVIRDVARVMGISYGDADMLAKCIDKGNIKLAEEYKAKAELRDLIAQREDFQELWQYALKLEGLNRSTGVHAAGVVIADKPLDHYVALARGKEGEVVTQADMNAITNLGLLKMDFLGLKNLTVIEEGVRLIRQKKPHFSLNDIPLNDTKTLELLDKGRTMGVFQLESAGMVKTCQKYGVHKIEDIIDLLALYRPGAMGFIDEMVAVKKGKAVVYDHPLLQEISESTYGVMIYQEQVLNAAKVLAGYSLGRADLLRKAMGKKDEAIMSEQRADFIQGAYETNNIEEKKASIIFDKIAGFAGYGFNKSHSACYAYISYWTGYLKAHYPVEFLCGLLSSEMQNLDKIRIFLQEAQAMNIVILPPDINSSFCKFMPEKTPFKEWGIRYGLGAIKNAGEAVAKTIEQERKERGEFTTLKKLATRFDSKVLHRKMLESYIAAGALDSLHSHRSALTDAIEQMLNLSFQASQDRNAGQSTFFEAFDQNNHSEQELGTILIDSSKKPWDKQELLAHEMTLLGYYRSGHPLENYKIDFYLGKYQSVTAVKKITKEQRALRIAGILIHYETRYTKQGNKFYVLSLEDLTGSIEVVYWLGKNKDYDFSEVNLLELKLRVTIDEQGGSRYYASGIKELPFAKKRQGCYLFLDSKYHGSKELYYIKQVLQEHPGNTSCTLCLLTEQGKKYTCQLKEKVQYSDKLIEKLHLFF